MALAQLDFFSEVLGLCCQATVILPQSTQGIGQAGSVRAGKAPVLWLLHGGSDDHTIWQRRTSVERYVAPLGLAVVMPAVQLSFYTNMAYGGRYFDYVADELPAIMRDFFHFSDRREDNFVAGLSMGGYGAFKLALTRPEQYAAAASLSGVLDIAAKAQQPTPAQNAGKTPDWDNLLKLVFGDTQQIQGSPHDLFHLLRTARRQNTNLPKLYASCGTEDLLYPDNTAFRDFAKSLGVALTYHEAPGTHEWGYWDYTIQQVLDWLPL